MRIQKAWLHILEQMLHCEKCIYFGCVEPQAWNFEWSIFSIEVFFDDVPTLLCIPNDWAVHTRAQVLNISLEGCGRDFQLHP